MSDNVFPECFLALVPSVIHISPMFKKFLNVDNISDKCSHIKNHPNDNDKYHYILSRKLIGVGTFSKVYRAIDMNNIRNNKNRFNAVKVLKKKNKYYDTKLVEREITTLLKLDHPNIIKLNRVIETESNVYIIMEYAYGKELFKLLGTKYSNGMDENMVRVIIHSVLNALSYCHSVGVAHRDLKPENIIIDENLNLKIVDFGLSAIFGSKMTAKTSCGTLNYFAPEMIYKEEYNAPAVDVWGVGIMTYACIYVKLPYDGANIYDTYRLIKQGPPDFTDRNISDTLKDFILTILCIDPDKRPTINELLKHSFISGEEKLHDNKNIPMLDMTVIKNDTIPLCIITPHSEMNNSTESIGDKSLFVKTDIIEKRNVYTKSGDLPEDDNDTITPLGRLGIYTNRRKNRRNSIDYSNIDKHISPNNTRGITNDIYADDIMKTLLNALKSINELKITITTTSGIICTYRDTDFSIQIKKINGINVKSLMYNFLNGSKNTYFEIREEIESKLYI